MPIDRSTAQLIEPSDSGARPNWQNINRLLLAYTWPSPEADLQPAAALLQMPAVQIGLLCPGSNSPGSNSPGSNSPGSNSPGSACPRSDWTLGMLDQPAVALPDGASLIAQLVQCRFDAVIIFTQPFQSPYSIAYFSYLAGIPIRVGQSSEFGGSLLSHPVQPPLDPVCGSVYSQHLLESVGLFPSV